MFKQVSYFVLNKFRLTNNKVKKLIRSGIRNNNRN